MKNQEQIVDGIIADYLETKFSGVKEKLSKTSKYFKRGAKASILGTDRKVYELIKTLEGKNSECDYLTYFDELVNAYRQYVKVADVEREDFGEVMTPITLVEEILDILPSDVWSNPNLKWLDPCNGVGTFPSIVVQRLMKGLETFEKNPIKRYRHIIEEMIYVCELQPKNMFIFQCVFDKDDTNELNTYCGSFLDENFDNHMKNVWGVEKFDIVMGNPPYNQMIDMDFVKKSYKISDKILFVHPSTWLLDEKNKQKKFISTKELIANDLESIVLFNGNKLFNIQLFVPCVITYINKNKTNNKINCLDKTTNTSITYENINNINKYSNNDVYPILKNKILSFCFNDNLLKHKGIVAGTYYVNTAQIRGHVNLKSETNMVLDDFYTIVTKDTQVTNEKSKHMFFSFSTLNEANNFLSYLKTKFCMFSLSIYKNNSQLDRGELASIPYLDFTQEWTDEKLYKEFNLTEEEINFINTHIPKYY